MTYESLNNTQKKRYNRHIILDGFGLDGQLKLLNAKVLIVGAGGLGSPMAMYLAAAGVGTIGIVDGDVVSLSNLQRQIIHATKDVNQPKVASATCRMQDINPDVKVIPYETFLTEQNALEIIQEYDYVLDGTDNFSPKYLINDACVMLKKPFSMGGISRYTGQLMTHIPGSACYRCLFPGPPALGNVETCAVTGVLGSIAGICGTLLSTECIKYFIGGDLLTNTLLTFDAITMNFCRFNFKQNNSCAMCGVHPTITELKEYAFKPCTKKNKN